MGGLWRVLDIWPPLADGVPHRIASVGNCGRDRTLALSVDISGGFFSAPRQLGFRSWRFSASLHQLAGVSECVGDFADSLRGGRLRRKPGDLCLARTQKETLKLCAVPTTVNSAACECMQSVAHRQTQLLQIPETGLLPQSKFRTSFPQRK